jgi:Ca2+-binding EF-hand superfamily protein
MRTAGESVPENMDSVIKGNMPSHDYPYFINSYQLMGSKNKILQQSQNENKFKSKLVIYKPELADIKSLHADTTRNVKISDEDVSALSAEQLQDHVERIFGVHAKNVIGHHSQIVAYYVLSPVMAYYLGGNSNDYMIQRGRNNILENIFLYENRIPLRSVAQEFIYLKIPQDPEFLLTEKLAETNKPRSGQSPEEVKTDVELNWKKWWKFKYNCKVLARATNDGYEILGIGTDNPLIAAFYLGDEKSLQLTDEMINTVLKIQIKANEFLKKMQTKLESAPAEKIDAIKSKVTNLEKLLEKIDLFKNGELTFPQFVNIVTGLYKISRDIEHTGPVSVPLNKALNFLGVHIASGTTASLNSYAQELKRILNDMIASAKPALRPALDDTSKEVDFKEKFNEVKTAIQNYLDNRDDKLSFLSKNFDRDRGQLRATAYITLLEQAQTPLGQAIIILALLNGEGTQLKNKVVNSFGGASEKEIKDDLLKVIKTALPVELLQDTAIKLMNNITAKADSNKKVNFEEEFKAMSTIELGTSAPRRPSPPRSP